MRKHIALLAVIPAMLAVLGCEIPKAIEVRAAPKINISNDNDMTENIKSQLRDALKGKFDKMAFANNTRDENLVVVGQKEVASIEKAALFSAVNDVIKTINVTVNGQSMTIAQALGTFGGEVTPGNVNNILASESVPVVGPYVTAVLSAPVPKQDLPYPTQNADIPIDITNDILANFKVKDSSGELFIADYAAGSQFDQFIGYKLGVNLPPGAALTNGEMKKMPASYVNFAWDNEDAIFQDFEPQNNGYKITNMFVNNNLNVKFSLAMLKDATVRQLLECLKDMDLKAEIIAWVPLKFEPASGDAFFWIPMKDAMGVKDLFFREEKEGGKDEKELLKMEKMSVEVEFKSEKFNEMFERKDVEITNADEEGKGSVFIKEYTLQNKKLEIIFEEKDMEAIYKDPRDDPFFPSIKVIFKPGQELMIPYELVITNILINGNMVVRVDL
jgi:hypothetical protein